MHAAAGSPSLRRVAAAAEARMRATKAAGAAKSTVGSQRISDWRSGRNLPARFEAFLPVLLTLIDKAKSSDDQVPPTLLNAVAWRKLWEAAVEWEPEPESLDVVSPYLGLAAYGESDAQLFFGRAKATAEFVDVVTRVARTGGLVVMVGSSGAGKSSLLQAGLVSSFAGGPDGWDIVTITPGATPTATLNRALGSAKGKRLVIVDQFEELFTSCGDEAERGAYVQAIDGIAGSDDNGVTVVIAALRADFFARCLEFPPLAAALRHCCYLLGPMTVDELTEAITKPAESAGLKLAPGLDELVISELCGLGGHEGAQSYDPGALPLLSHVMEATWQRRDNRKLTIAGYRKAGGVAGSVAATAEQAWEALTGVQQTAAKRLLLGLVTVGHDSRDTRRRVARDELVGRAGNLAAAEAALEALVRARLVTVDAGKAFFTHEIVLDCWPRLRGWLAADRVGYLVRQRLEADAAEWDSEGREPALLYRGARLETTAQHAENHHVGASAAAYLAAAQAARLRNHRRSVAVKAVLALLGVAVLALATATFVQSRRVAKQRDDAILASVMADADRLRESDPSVSANLDVMAHQLRPDDPNVQARILASQNLPLARPLGNHHGPVTAVAFDRDGRIFASASMDGEVRLWRLGAAGSLEIPRPLGNPLTGHDGGVTAAAFSPNGRLLATGGSDHSVLLWDLSDPERPRRLGGPLRGAPGAVHSVAFRPDGRMLAVAGDTGAIALWDVADPSKGVAVGKFSRQQGAIRSVAFASDGRTLVAAGDDAAVQLWDVADAPAPLGEPLGARGVPVHSVAFRPDGRILAAVSADGAVALWDTANPRVPRALSEPWAAGRSEVRAVSFSADGAMLVTAGDEGMARLWNMTDPDRPAAVGGPMSTGADALLTSALSPSGTVATGGQDGAVMLWTPSAATVVAHAGRLARPGFSSDGARMATASADGVVRLWDARKPRELRPLASVATGRPIDTVSVSPDGRVLAVAGAPDPVVRLFSLESGSVRPVGEVRAGRPGIQAFSPDSRLLVTGDDDGALRVWDVADPARPLQVGDPLAASAAPGGQVRFAPRGRLLAVATDHARVSLWDMTNPRAPGRVGPGLLGGAASAVTGLTFTPDGRNLVLGNDEHLLAVWDVGDPSQPRLRGDPVPTHNVGDVSLSPDGKLLATTGGPRVQLWDASDLGALRPIGETITPPDTPEWVVAFDPAGGYLVGAGGSGTLRIWDLDFDRAIARICSVTSHLDASVVRHHVPPEAFSPPCDNLQNDP